MTTATQSPEKTMSVQSGSLIYRFDGELTTIYPIGLFPEGIRFHNDFSARVTDGPFAGGRIFGLDPFLLRPDGVGLIEAPEVIESGDVRVGVQVRGYVLPPADLAMPPIEVLADPGFEYPDMPFRVTASATFRCADPEYDWLNRTVAVIEGTVNLKTGRLIIEARAA